MSKAMSQSYAKIRGGTRRPFPGVTLRFFAYLSDTVYFICNVYMIIVASEQSYVTELRKDPRRYAEVFSWRNFAVFRVSQRYSLLYLHVYMIIVTYGAAAVI